MDAKQNKIIEAQKLVKDGVPLSVVVKMLGMGIAEIEHLDNEKANNIE